MSLKERSWRSPINLFWVVLFIGGISAFGYYVIYPWVMQIRARDAALSAIDEAHKEGDYPPYQATLPGKAGAAAIAMGKHVVPQILSALKNEKMAVRQKSIHIIEKITGIDRFKWGYDPDRGVGDEENLKALPKITEWYEKVKNDPRIK